MAVQKAVWTQNQAISGFNNASLIAGASTSGIIDLNASGYDVVNVQIQAVFGATPDGDVSIIVLHAPDGGTNFDTEPILSVALPAAANNTRRRTIPLPTGGNIKIQSINKDTADTVDVSAVYEGRTWSSN